MKPYHKLSDHGKTVAKNAGYVGFYGDRATTQEAYDYAIDVSKSFDGPERAAFLTALHVLTNTIALQIANEQEAEHENM